MRGGRVFHVYILASGPNSTLYTAMTNDLNRRVFEHREGLVEGFTKKYGVKQLVYFEQFPPRLVPFIAKSSSRNIRVPGRST
jgi:predicted GIY-YIG superfamily endonuclease